MFSGDTVRGRRKLLGNDEIVIECQKRNIFTLFIILFFDLANLVLWIGTLFLIFPRRTFNTSEWFIYEKSMMDNYKYYLITQANYHADQLLVNISLINSFDEILDTHKKSLKAGGRTTKFTGKWENIPKAQLYGDGRYDEVKPMYKKILNQNALKALQKGRRFGSEMNFGEDNRPSQDTTVYPMTGGDKSINLAFAAQKEEMGATTVMPYREQKGSGNDFEGNNARKIKRDLGETEEGHKRRMKYMNSLKSQGLKFDPNMWDFPGGHEK